MTRLQRPAGYVAVAHTCPTIDKAISLAGKMLVREHGDEMKELLETIRADNIQLRANAAKWESAANRLYKLVSEEREYVRVGLEAGQLYDDIVGGKLSDISMGCRINTEEEDA